VGFDAGFVWWFVVDDGQIWWHKFCTNGPRAPDLRTFFLNLLKQ